MEVIKLLGARVKVMLMEKYRMSFHLERIAIVLGSIQMDESDAYRLALTPLIQSFPVSESSTTDRI